MQKEAIIQKLKERGCRITKQRLMLIDIIMEEDYSCCKEIYYRASQLDPQIGIATIYRMVNTLEEIGAISRKNMYRISDVCECDGQNGCVIEFEDHSVCRLSSNKLQSVMLAGLKACGYVNEQKIKHIALQPCPHM